MWRRSPPPGSSPHPRGREPQRRWAGDPSQDNDVERQKNAPEGYPLYTAMYIHIQQYTYIYSKCTHKHTHIYIYIHIQQYTYTYIYIYTYA